MFTRRFLLILTFLLLSISNTNAKNSYKSEQNYFGELYTCQLAIKELEWSYSLWPEQNKTPKPKFSEVIDTSLLKLKIRKILKQQALLKKEFGVEISNEMLQGDINRMAMNTKDSEKLKQLFKALDNNPQKIAHCISLPNLVTTKINNLYATSNRIHASLKMQAQNELRLYKGNHSVKLDLAKVLTTTYKIEDKARKKPNFDKSTVFLNQSEFVKKSINLKNMQGKLLDKQGYFVYITVSESSADTLKVRKLIWQKERLDSWLQKQSSADIIMPQTYKFQLPEILASHGAMKNTDYDLWRPYHYQSRIRHTAVWTGSKMIIWGGFNGGKTLDTGLVYDPTTDMFTKITAIDPPSARESHTAVWTGSEMIVWGGKDNNSYKNDGKKYNPNTNTWTPIASSALTARAKHTAVYTNGKMLIWGGETNGSFSNTGSIYTVATDTWQSMATSNAPSARALHSATYNVFYGPGGVAKGGGTNGLMVIWGGYNGSVALNTGASYDVNNDNWTTMSVSGAPLPRFEHKTAIISIPNDNNGGNSSNGIVISSGKDENDVLFNDIKVYFPFSNLWDTLGSNSFAGREGMTVTQISANSLIFWGGCDLTACYSSGEKADLTWNSGSNNVSINLTPMQQIGAASARKGHTALSIGDQILYFGGERLDTGLESLAARYVLSLDSWIPVDSPKNPPIARKQHSATLIGNEIMIWGGIDDLDNPMTSGYRYNLLTDTWLPTSSTNEPSLRSAYSTIWTGNDVIIWGGFNPNTFSSSNTGAKYNALNDIWISTTVPVDTSGDLNGLVRYNHSAVWTGSAMIIWGGICFDDFIYKTGLIYYPNSNSWSPLSDNNGNLPTRQGHFAYWTGNSMVIWGGDSYDDNGQPILKYAGGSWSVLNLSGAPVVASNDPLFGQFNNYGGQNIVSIGEDMLVWNNGDGNNGNSLALSNTGKIYHSATNTWTDISVLNAPDARHSSLAAWTGKEVVIWGGNDDLGNLITGGRYQPETDTWQTMTTAHAPSNTEQSITWTGQEIVLWGGLDSNGDVSNDMDFYFSTSFANTGNCSSNSDVIFCNGFEAP